MFDESKYDAEGPTSAYSKTYSLDHRFSIEFQLDATNSSIDVYWSPHLPKGRKAKSLRAAYIRARHDFLGSLGLNVLVIDL